MFRVYLDTVVEGPGYDVHLLFFGQLDEVHGIA